MILNLRGRERFRYQFWSRRCGEFGFQVWSESRLLLYKLIRIRELSRVRHTSGSCTYINILSLPFRAKVAVGSGCCSMAVDCEELQQGDFYAKYNILEVLGK